MSHFGNSQLLFPMEEGGLGMLSKEGLILLHHYIQEGLSKTAVSEKLGISPNPPKR